jgi:antitoxin HigA-1
MQRSAMRDRRSRISLRSIRATEPRRAGQLRKIVAKLPPLHPGEMLREEFLKPMGLTPYAVAKACSVPRTRIERIVREELGISADTALRLAKFFGMSVEFWVNLQAQYDVETAKNKIAKELKAIEPVRRRAA